MKNRKEPYGLFCAIILMIIGLLAALILWDIWPVIGVMIFGMAYIWGLTDGVIYSDQLVEEAPEENPLQGKSDEEGRQIVLDAITRAIGDTDTITKINLVEIMRLRNCLEAAREAICRGPVDDVLWHPYEIGSTVVDEITRMLDDGWSYDQWTKDHARVQENATPKHR